MKRIITIVLSVMLAITASAQTKTLLDKILEPLNETCNYKQIYHDGPNRICTQQHYDILFNYNIFSHRSSPHNDSISRKQVLINKYFCNCLDSLMKIAEEGYHYETHYKGKGDTIIYSICLRNTDSGEKGSKNNQGEVVYPDAIESISYEFRPIKYGLNFKDTILGGQGNLTYSKVELIDEIRPFNKEQYYEIIQPVLKQKGIKSWKFKWEVNDNYDFFNTREYTHGTIYPAGGGYAHFAGKREGTMYFIPKENKELGDKISNAIDSLTFNYIHNNPEQDFLYSSIQHDDAKKGLAPNHWNSFQRILSSQINIDDLVEVFLGFTEYGYYIAVSENTGSNGYPREWYRLKSFNNGKKEYIKGTKE